MLCVVREVCVMYRVWYDVCAWHDMVCVCGMVRVMFHMCLQMYCVVCDIYVCGVPVGYSVCGMCVVHVAVVCAALVYVQGDVGYDVVQCYASGACRCV